MEQFFIVIVVLAIWIFRGVAGAQRRFPPAGSGDEGAYGSGGRIDIAGSTRERTLEGQQRAIEALRRWEAKQGLGGTPTADRTTEVQESSERWDVPAASRTRTARPATFARHTTAERKRREAYAEIARMLDPGQAPPVSSQARRRFEVAPAAAPVSRGAPVAETSSLEDPAELQAVKDRRVRAAASRKAAADERTVATGPGRTVSGRRAGASGLARLEKLPLAARALVSAEILGPPRSLA